MDLEALYRIYRSHPVVCHDTRRIERGCIYWSIRGERFDGNTFAGQALQSGAAYAVVDDEAYKLNAQCILVDDALDALQKLAALHRKKLGLKVLAITGSNGKTTTKELMLRVLSTKMDAFATPGNLNNHIGLPLTLLKLNESHQAAIIELGANHLGENAALCAICRPDAGIITNIGKDHLEGFGGMAGVEKANAELFDYLRIHGGTILLNTDDAVVCRNAEGLKAIRYGTGENAQIQGKIIGRFPFISADEKIKESGDTMQVSSQLFGSFQLYNLLAATAAGIYFGVAPQKIKQALESYVPGNNRSQVLKKGSNTIILDAYNANPSSMGPAVADFMDYPAKNKVLILGDMFELGEDSQQEHDAILEGIDFENFAAVALAGQEFYSLRTKYSKGKFFETTADLKEWFAAQNFKDATIYLKGSRGMKMEEIVS